MIQVQRLVRGTMLLCIAAKLANLLIRVEVHRMVDALDSRLGLIPLVIKLLM